MILDDPELTGVGAVLFDEFHERSLDADLGLALALDAQAGLREDLRILVMSATLDGARVAGLLGDAPVVASEGRAFPVETRYLDRDPNRRIEESVTEAVLRALRADPGSVLVFLPGQAEIRRTAEALADKVGPDVILAPLYGALTPAEQDRAVGPAPADLRKVVLATSIAETSLTIEGVRIVVDSGLARVPVYEPGLGLTPLVTSRASRAAADQRRGRAGRTEPGVCWRLWAEAGTGALDAFARPEILSSDLAGLLLDCAAWGVADPRSLRFLDPPPAAALTEARTMLEGLGALDADGRLTETGQRLRALPLPPRLARMVATAAMDGRGRAAANLAAALVERGLGGDGVDLDERVERFTRDRGGRAADMRRLAENWARIAGGGRDAEPSPAGPLLALAYPDRVARARGREGEFVMASGRAGRLDPANALARETFLVVADLAGNAGNARILAAAAMTPEAIERLFADRIESATQIVFDSQAAALRARAVRRLGAVNLGEKTLPVPADENAAAILAKGVAGLGLDRLPWTSGLAQWRARVNFLRAAEGAIWPDLSDATLTGTAEDWLAPAIVGRTSLAAITADDLANALHGLLPWSSGPSSTKPPRPMSRCRRALASRSTTPPKSRPLRCGCKSSSASIVIQAPEGAPWCSTSCRQPSDRFRSPGTCPVSGAAPGPSFARRCGVATPATLAGGSSLRGTDPPGEAAGDMSLPPASAAARGDATRASQTGITTHDGERERRSGGGGLGPRGRRGLHRDRRPHLRAGERLRFPGRAEARQPHRRRPRRDADELRRPGDGHRRHPGGGGRELRHHPA